MKKDLTGGLANLLSGADQRVTEQRAGADPQTQQAKEEEQHPTEQSLFAHDEAALLDTIQDSTLRANLEKRLVEKKRALGGRPRKGDPPKESVLKGYSRTTLFIDDTKWSKIKEIGLRETLTLKEILNIALDVIIERYESKHGEIVPQVNPKKDISEIF